MSTALDPPGYAEFVVSGRPRSALPRWFWMALAGVLLLVGCAYLFRYIITDDSYIDYRFAENFAAGHGLVFNPGERIEGYSNFLLVLVLAALIKFGIDPVVGAKVVSVSCGVGAIFVTGLLAQRVAPNRPRTSGIACVLLALSPPFLIWCVSGLETTLYTLLLLAAVLVHVMYAQSGYSSARLRLASVAAFLGAALTRPEGPIIFFAVLCLDLACAKASRL